MIFQERKVWALAESRRGMTQDEVKNECRGATPLKTGIFLRGKLGSLPEGEWVVAEFQRGMIQYEVKIVCRGATPWKTGIFFRGRVELFTGGWVSCCWDPKRDDAENEKSNYKTGEGNRKGKYKHFVWYTLMYTKVFSFSCKDL